MMSTIEFDYTPDLDIADLIARYVYPKGDLLLVGAHEHVDAICIEAKAASDTTGYEYIVSVHGKDVVVEQGGAVA